MPIQNPPPYAEAAERRTVDMWVCRVCRQGWPVDGRDPAFDAERAARSCHTGQYPCYREGCAELTVPHRTLCPAHMAEHEAAEAAKRRAEPWNGHMVWSETLEELFPDPGEAEARAEEDLGDGATPEEVRAELERLSDWLPDEDHGRDPLGVDSACAAEVKALNAAIQALPPVYEPTTTRLDLDAKAVAP